MEKRKFTWKSNLGVVVCKIARFQKFCDWINTWGNVDQYNKESRDFKDGYNQAMSDTLEKLELKTFT